MEEYCFRGRDMKNVKNRWDRHIKVEVPKFNMCYRNAKTPLQSGKTEEDYIKDADEAYNEEYGHYFLFKNCLEVLWTIPKFDPMIEHNDDNSDLEDAVEEGRQRPSIILRLSALPEFRIESSSKD